MVIGRWFCVIVLGAAILLPGTLWSGDRKSKPEGTTSATPHDKSASSAGSKSGKHAPNKRGNERDGETAAAREAVALDFAHAQHPELAELLLQLKTSNKQEYGAAVRELARTSERLARIRDKSPERYDIELEAWQLDSQIRLLAARLTMSDSSKLESELKDLLQKRVDLRLKQRQALRDSLTAQLAQLDVEIEKLQTDGAAIAESDFEKLKRGFLKGNGRSKKPGPESAADKPAKPGKTIKTNAK